MNRYLLLFSIKPSCTLVNIFFLQLLKLPQRINVGVVIICFLLQIHNMSLFFLDLLPILFYNIIMQLIFLAANKKKGGNNDFIICNINCTD